MNESIHGLSDLLRSISSGLQYPVMLILVVLMVVTLVMLGSLIGETFTEHRFLKVQLPKLMEEIRLQEKPLEQILDESKLLMQHKKLLKELIAHPDFSEHMREALGNRLMDEEQSRLERRTKISDVIAKLGPIFGLLGTLIPLGPGIMALGQGDTLMLSQSLLTAFDTTVVGMIVAAVALIISTIHKSWYRNDMSILITLTECVIEVENERRGQHVH